MKIKRDGKEYELTPAELQEAYREVRRMDRLDDAEAQLSEFCNVEFDGDEDLFAETFGFSINEVCDKTSAHYLLDQFVEAFEKHQTCVQAESDCWEECIRNVLIANAVNFEICYQADYSVQYEVSCGISYALFHHRYKTMEELEQAAAACIYAAMRRRKTVGSSLLVSTSVQKVKIVGNSDTLTEYEVCKEEYARKAEIKDGKLEFIREDAEIRKA